MFGLVNLYNRLYIAYNTGWFGDKYLATHTATIDKLAKETLKNIKEDDALLDTKVAIIEGYYDAKSAGLKDDEISLKLGALNIDLNRTYKKDVRSQFAKDQATFYNKLNDIEDKDLRATLTSALAKLNIETKHEISEEMLTNQLHGLYKALQPRGDALEIASKLIKALHEGGINIATIPSKQLAEDLLLYGTSDPKDILDIERGIKMTVESLKLTNCEPVANKQGRQYLWHFVHMFLPTKVTDERRLKIVHFLLDIEQSLPAPDLATKEFMVKLGQRLGTTVTEEDLALAAYLVRANSSDEEAKKIAQNIPLFPNDLRPVEKVIYAAEAAKFQNPKEVVQKLLYLKELTKQTYAFSKVVDTLVKLLKEVPLNTAVDLITELKLDHCNLPEDITPLIKDYRLFQSASIAVASSKLEWKSQEEKTFFWNYLSGEKSPFPTVKDPSQLLQLANQLSSLTSPTDEAMKEFSKFITVAKKHVNGPKKQLAMAAALRGADPTGKDVETLGRLTANVGSVATAKRLLDMGKLYSKAKHDFKIEVLPKQLLLCLALVEDLTSEKAEAALQLLDLTYTSYIENTMPHSQTLREDLYQEFARCFALVKKEHPDIPIEDQLLLARHIADPARRFDPQTAVLRDLLYRASERLITLEHAENEELKGQIPDLKIEVERLKNQLNQQQQVAARETLAPFNLYKRNLSRDEAAELAATWVENQFSKVQGKRPSIDLETGFFILTGEREEEKLSTEQLLNRYNDCKKKLTSLPPRQICTAAARLPVEGEIDTKSLNSFYDIAVESFNPPHLDVAFTLWSLQNTLYPKPTDEQLKDDLSNFISFLNTEAQTTGKEALQIAKELISLKWNTSLAGRADEEKDKQMVKEWALFQRINKKNALTLLAQKLDSPNPWRELTVDEAKGMTPRAVTPFKEALEAELASLKQEASWITNPTIDELLASFKLCQERLPFIDRKTLLSTATKLLILQKSYPKAEAKDLADNLIEFYKAWGENPPEGALQNAVLLLSLKKENRRRESSQELFNAFIRQYDATNQLTDSLLHLQAARQLLALTWEGTFTEPAAQFLKNFESRGNIRSALPGVTDTSLKLTAAIQLIPIQQSNKRDKYTDSDLATLLNNQFVQLQKEKRGLSNQDLMKRARLDVLENLSSKGGLLP